MLSEYEEDCCGKTGKISVKGKLKEKFSFWKSINANKFILQVIDHGYKIPFIETPKSVIFDNNKTALDNEDFVLSSIAELLACGSIKQSDAVPHVVSPLSVATNASGKKRLILDLRYVNSHLFKDYIRFDDWRSFEHFLIPDAFCFKFDLKSGYHHVDIFDPHQTFLGFSWKRNGKCYYFVFTVLPFGLSVAPFVFTKLLRPLVSYWHSYGVKICVYLDDGLGIDSNYNQAIEHSVFVRETLRKAGFVSNEEKSQWNPVRNLTWLGITLDLSENVLFIKNERIISILSMAEEGLLSRPYTTARTLAKFAGKIMSTIYIIGNITRLK